MNFKITQWFKSFTIYHSLKYLLQSVFIEPSKPKINSIEKKNKCQAQQTIIKRKISKAKSNIYRASRPIKKVNMRTNNSRIFYFDENQLNIPVEFQRMIKYQAMDNDIETDGEMVYESQNKMYMSLLSSVMEQIYE